MNKLFNFIIYVINSKLSMNKCFLSFFSIKKQLVLLYFIRNIIDIADSFNLFFANVGAQLSSSFEQSDSIPSFETYLDCNTRSDPNFYFTPVDEDLVLTLLTNLPNKNSSGIDNI